jgi:hypothetical protein
MKDTSIPVMMNVVTESFLPFFSEIFFFEILVSKFFPSISKNLVGKKFRKKNFLRAF